MISPLRSIKDEAEIAALSAAGAAADRVAAALLAGELPLIGRSEAEVSKELGRRLLAEGHHKVNFAIVGSGPSSASPHHEPSGRVIGASEAVVCDFGGTLRLDDNAGYCSDITRTIVTGEVDPGFLELYSVLEAAQAVAVEVAVVGAPCEAVDAAARNPIAEAGYGEAFIHRVGHGIGIEEHEDPYLVAGNTRRLVAGHAFSIEPGIYLPGRFGARIEDIVVATEDGPLRCNVAEHSLQVVEACAGDGRGSHCRGGRCRGRVAMARVQCRSVAAAQLRARRGRPLQPDLRGERRPWRLRRAPASARLPRAADGSRHGPRAPHPHRPRPDAGARSPHARSLPRPRRERGAVLRDGAHEGPRPA